MMLPNLGLVRGTQMTICRPGSASLSSRAFAASARPPSVSFATTSTRAIVEALLMRLRHRRRTGRGRDLGLAEHPVHRPRDAVLVGTTDDRRYRVEVEHRRGRRDLPLER